MAHKTAFLYTDRFLEYNLGSKHPLQQRRLQMVYRLLKAYGVLSPTHYSWVPDPIDWQEPKAATRAEILRVHTPDFVEAVERAGSGESLPREFLAKHGLAPGDTPAFPGMYEAAALYAGGSLDAARLVLSGEYDRAFNVAGGLHHAYPHKASGFCTFNDLAMAIDVFLQAGMERVMYVDIDVHHGDGVQYTFYNDPRVMTLSLHESGRFLFPGLGFPEDIGEGAGVGTSLNVAYFPYTLSDVWWEGFEAVVPLAFERFAPQAVVLQFGADAHWEDPLAHLLVTSETWMRAVHRLLELSAGVPTVITGGGGYNIKTVARLWAMVTAACAGIELPNDVPDTCAQEYEIFRLHDEATPTTEEAIQQQARAYKDEMVSRLFAALGW